MMARRGPEASDGTCFRDSLERREERLSRVSRFARLSREGVLLQPNAKKAKAQHEAIAGKKNLRRGGQGARAAGVSGDGCTLYQAAF